MEIRKNISVWLVLQDGENKGKVALQKRSGGEKEFPYLCQSTWSGKVEPNEDIMEAVARECKEEMGEEFAMKIDFQKLEFLTESTAVTNGVEWHCSNYFGEVSDAVIKTAKIHDDAFPDLIFVDKNTEIFSLKTNVDPKHKIVLFDDQYNILKNILK